MTSQSPDTSRPSPQAFSEEAQELMALIRDHRRHAGQPMTDAAIFEDAIRAYYDLLVERGILNDKE